MKRTTRWRDGDIEAALFTILTEISETLHRIEVMLAEAMSDYEHIEGIDSLEVPRTLDD